MKTKIPITTGIIGHLDAVITDEHKRSITCIFNELYERCPHSPVYLFSQLAKGADIEVAKLFIEIKEQLKRDYHLIVPLPFQKEIYRNAFNADEKVEFDLLISKAVNFFELAHIDNADLIDVNSTKSLDNYYKKSGCFVADSSIILIAIWDENDTKKDIKVGGTVDIVLYKKGETQDDNIFDQKGDLISLPCNRTRVAEQKRIKLPSSFLNAFFNKNNTIEKSIINIEELNKGFLKVSHAEIVKSANKLYAHNVELDSQTATLKNYYAAIDVLAIDNQKMYNNIIQALFVMGLAFIVFFDLYNPEFPFKYSSAAALILLIAAYIIFKISVKRKYHIKFLEFRILAEVLRIQFFWKLIGLKNVVSNYILIIHRYEFLWIKHIVLAINGVLYNTEKSNVFSHNINLAWIQKEKAYFTHKVTTFENSRKNLNNTARAFFIIAILSLLSFFIKTNVYPIAVKLEYITATIGISLGIVASIKAYLEIKGIQQTINQYVLMKNIYTIALEKIEALEKSEMDIKLRDKKIENIYLMTGKEALIENGSWYLIFKQKEPKVHI